MRELRPKAKEPRLVLRLGIQQLPSSSNQKKSDTILLLPKKNRNILRIACYQIDQPPKLIAHTEWKTVNHSSALQFNTPIQLWNAASGKGTPVQLKFAVEKQAFQDEDHKLVAFVHIPSDELRRCGQGMSREGASLGLPLTLQDGHMIVGTLLQCYIHAGYGRRLQSQVEGIYWDMKIAIDFGGCADELILCACAINRHKYNLVLHGMNLSIPDHWELLDNGIFQNSDCTLPPGGSACSRFRLRLEQKSPACTGEWSFCETKATIRISYSINGEELTGSENGEAGNDDMYKANSRGDVCGIQADGVNDRSVHQLQKWTVELPSIFDWYTSVEIRHTNLAPSSPRVGDWATLDFELKWNHSTLLQATPEELLQIEIELKTGSCWTPIGCVRYRLSFSGPHPQLFSFTVIPTMAGRLELPSLCVWRISNFSDDETELVRANKVPSFSRLVSNDLSSGVHVRERTADRQT